MVWGSGVKLECEGWGGIMQGPRLAIFKVPLGVIPTPDGQEGHKHTENCVWGGGFSWAKTGRSLRFTGQKSVTWLQLT